MEGRVNWIKTKWESCYDNKQLGEQLFLLGFIAYLGASVWGTTMFPFSGLASKCLKLIYLSLIGIKVIAFDRYQLKTLLILGLCGAATILVLLSSGYKDPFMWVILVVASKDVSFEKILKVYLVIAGAIVALAFGSSLLGVIENLQYTKRSGAFRNSFGIMYTTDFAAHIFYLFLTFFYLKGEKLRLVHYAGGLIIAALILQFCDARVDTICIVLTTVLFGIGNMFTHSHVAGVRVKKGWERFWKTYGPYSMPVFAAFSVLITAMFNKGNGFWTSLDEFLFHSRLGLGKKGMEEYGFSLFGQYIEMVGNGGTTKHMQDYFFLDCSYVNTLLRFGTVMLFLLIGIYIYCCIKNRQDLYFLYAVALISLNSVIAHHMIEIEYNPFMLAVLTTDIAAKGGNMSLFNRKNPGRMVNFHKR